MAMRSQVDGAVQVLSSPSSGASAYALCLALMRFPGVVDLTLLHVSDASAPAPLSTARLYASSSLAGLTRLTVRQVGAWGSMGARTPHAARIARAVHGRRMAPHACQGSMHGMVMHTRTSHAPLCSGEEGYSHAI
jgi:hypothetical protein